MKNFEASKQNRDLDQVIADNSDNIYLTGGDSGEITLLLSQYSNK